MSKHHKKFNNYVDKKAFTSPGTLVYVGKEVTDAAVIKLVEFNQEHYQEKTIKNLNDCRPPLKENQVTWLDVDGVHEVSKMEVIGKFYNLHPLVLEDILNTEQKPKLEHFGEKHLFTILKMFQFNPELNRIESEHVALVLGDNFLLSFQETHQTDVFAPIFSRLKASVGKTRRNKADYLYYSCCDLVVDNYFIVLEKLGEKLEDLEIKIIDKPEAKDQNLLYHFKRELMTVRKAVLPLRDMFGTLVREDSPLIQSTIHVYLRDLYDHILQILDTIETYREMIENIQNIYLTSLSNKMNSVMKTLTVFTAIFMPLTFIAGIYGMNFDNMPELHHPYGYFYTLGFMVLITITLWIYFKWKKYV